MYRAVFASGESDITLDIQDTGGSYAQDFPAMIQLSLASAHAVVLVFSVADEQSFEDLERLRRVDLA